MRFKFSIFLMTLSLIQSVQAAENEALPMDLIELLGELEDEDLESLGEESLNTTLHDAKASAKKRTNGPIRSNEPRRTNEVGGQ